MSYPKYFSFIAWYKSVCFVRITGPKVEEVVTAWKNYASECHQRVVQCKVLVVNILGVLGHTQANSRAKEG